MINRHNNPSHNDNNWREAHPHAHTKDIDTEDQIKFHYHACYASLKRHKILWSFLWRIITQFWQLKCSAIHILSTVERLQKYSQVLLHTRSHHYGIIEYCWLFFCCLHFKCEMDYVYCPEKQHSIYVLMCAGDMRHKSFMVVKLLMVSVGFGKCQ